MSTIHDKINKNNQMLKKLLEDLESDLNTLKRDYDNSKKSKSFPLKYHQAKIEKHLISIKEIIDVIIYVTIKGTDYFKSINHPVGGGLFGDSINDVTTHYNYALNHIRSIEQKLNEKESISKYEYIKTTMLALMTTLGLLMKVMVTKLSKNNVSSNNPSSVLISKANKINSYLEMPKTQSRLPSNGSLERELSLIRKQKSSSSSSLSSSAVERELRLLEEELELEEKLKKQSGGKKKPVRKPVRKPVKITKKL